jgi:hypothetical protein
MVKKGIGLVSTASTIISADQLSSRVARGLHAERLIDQRRYRNLQEFKTLRYQVESGREAKVLLQEINGGRASRIGGDDEAELTG